MSFYFWLAQGRPRTVWASTAFSRHYPTAAAAEALAEKTNSLDHYEAI